MLPASASSPLHLDLTAKVKYTPFHNDNALAQALSPDMSHTCKMKEHGRHDVAAKCPQIPRHTGRFTRIWSKICDHTIRQVGMVMEMYI